MILLVPLHENCLNDHVSCWISLNLMSTSPVSGFEYATCKKLKISICDISDMHRHFSQRGLLTVGCMFFTSIKLIDHVC